MSDVTDPSTDETEGEDERRIELKHGAGGTAMRDLVNETLAANFSDPADALVCLADMDDGAVVPIGDANLVVTTDTHVIDPPFFPGGDIGRLAVSGTVNDLAVMGATDVRGLTSAVVVEANYPVANLERIADSMAATCAEADAPVVTGDTKVMGNGELDGVIVNTAGVGIAEHVTPDAGLSPNDVVIVTDSVGEHGISLLAEREGIEFGSDLESDVKPLNGLLAAALETAGEGVTAMKDPTRMGLAGALNELARKSGVGIEIREERVPVTSDVKGTGEMLGLDPFQIANEGVAVLGVAPTAAEDVLTALRDHPKGTNAAAIGKAIDDHRGRVVLDTGIGNRYLREPASEPAPRIC
ncbi:hydrogenase expression/formation protein HypE [Natrinema salifodinae]|uniref:Hydrogenase expression/formation protein HypE n=1 Tax=Natrinema salifodinae TaxID=1202768 RepID=A0A1I0P3B1_9EURY|nr:hydrogenase expression/formation protein HypE [Natrinema salifodinae]SEW08835.1 hydrogenase expression/formation protein HypE [Natrinema salifodinae]